MVTEQKRASIITAIMPTKKEIETTPAGSVVDKWISRYVLCEKTWRNPKPYSTVVSACWEIVDWYVEEVGTPIDMGCWCEKPGEPDSCYWRVLFGDPIDEPLDNFGFAETMQLAVCRAALLGVRRMYKDWA